MLIKNSHIKKPLKSRGVC